MNPGNKKLVMFDFDGVLVNTLPMAYQIHKDSNAHFTWERFQDFSNGNFVEGIGKAISLGEHIVPDNFHEEYQKNLLTFTIHDILNDTILALADEYIVAIISSSQGSFIQEFLQKENLTECFSDVLGVDIHASKVVKINLLLDRYKVVPNDAIFITDTLGDIREANDCNVSSIGVTWGLHSRETLEKGNPSFIINDPQELLVTIQKIFN